MATHETQIDVHGLKSRMSVRYELDDGEAYLTEVQINQEWVDPDIVFGERAAYLQACLEVALAEEVLEVVQDTHASKKAGRELIQAQRARDSVHMETAGMVA